MIENPALEDILKTAGDISIVCEIYGSNVQPAINGFDPVNAIDCFAAIDGIRFRTRTYKKLVKKFGSVRRTITNEINSMSVEFSNLTREISQFEFGQGFEGLILVIRLLSRSRSVNTSDTQVLFAGRCERPRSGKKDSLSVTAKFILDSIEVTIPRRKFAPKDYKGREPTDPEFEGFIFMPQYGTTVYSVRVKRGGIAGLFGFKKTVQKTLQYSSYSDLDSNKSVPEIFGFGQILCTHVGYIDVGTQIRIRSAWCEGEIEDLLNVRSTDARLPLSTTSYAEYYGKVGVLNTTNPTWVAPGYYSRTAITEMQANNSQVNTVEPAPDVAGVAKGRKLKTPDATTGIWNVFQWTNNAAAVVRYLLTGGDYYSLHENWIDDAAARTSFSYNAEKIFDLSSSDFLFLE